MEDDPDEEDMDDVNVDDERECHWMMVFENNDGGVYNAKVLLHAKTWNVYVNEMENQLKGGYLVEVAGN